jgi:hypothetical protein
LLPSETGAIAWQNKAEVYNPFCGLQGLNNLQEVDGTKLAAGQLLLRLGKRSPSVGEAANLVFNAKVFSPLAGTIFVAPRDA